MENPSSIDDFPNIKSPFVMILTGISQLCPRGTLRSQHPKGAMVRAVAFQSRQQLQFEQHMQQMQQQHLQQLQQQVTRGPNGP